MSAAPALVTNVEFRGTGLRIAYVPELLDSFAIDNVGWKVLVDTIFPNATSAESIIMALAYCRKRNLDIYKRPVHIVPMYSSAARAMIDTVWPSISEIRTTAFRTGQYTGREATQFGPDVEEMVGKEKVKFPEWAQITVYRSGQPFPGPRVYWRESYAWTKRDDETPNAMWRRRPHGQIEKCAEAAALRGAFPEEIGNDYAAEEMENQILIAENEPHVPAKRTPPAPPPAISHMPEAAMPEVRSQEPVTVEAATATEAQQRPPTPPANRDTPPAPPMPPPRNASPEFKATMAIHFDGEAIRKRFAIAASKAKDEAELGTAWEEIVLPFEDQFFPGDLSEVDKIYRYRKAELDDGE